MYKDTNMKPPGTASLDAPATVTVEAVSDQTSPQLTDVAGRTVEDGAVSPEGTLDKEVPVAVTDQVTPQGAAPIVKALAAHAKAKANKGTAATTPTSGPALFVRPHTPLGDAQLFYDMHQGQVFFVKEFEDFMCWTGKRFTFDGNALQRRARSVVNARYAEARSKQPLFTRNNESVTAKEALAWAKKISSNSGFKGMLDLFKDMKGVTVNQDQLDADPLKLGVNNGVLDLGTDKLIPNRPQYLITKHCRAAYRPDAKAPTFIEFLRQVTCDRPALQDFLQELFGYTLSGLTDERAFFIFLGTGTNGKGTLVELFFHLLGSYANAMPAHAFTSSESRAIRNDLARLPGIRLAASSEVNTNRKLDEAMVKRITGNDTIAARLLGKEYFDIRPVAKFFFSINTLPVVTGGDDAIHGRLIVVPFEGRFAAVKDTSLADKLRAEIDGVLAWAVAGFQRWHKRRRLVKPPCVVEACKAYREDMDIVHTFLEERCTIGVDLRESVRALYDDFHRWADQAFVAPVGIHLFSTLMKQKGFKQVKSGSHQWHGVALRDATPKAPQALTKTAKATKAPRSPKGKKGAPDEA